MSEMTPAGLLQQLQWRYATKQFDPEREVPAETWNTLENSLILSPSSFGLQPWHFFIIKNPALRSELLPHSWNQQQVVDCSHFVVFASLIKPGEKDVDTFIQRTAEVRGVEVDTLQGYRDVMAGFMDKMDDADLQRWAKMQTYIALGQFMTSAAALGVDTCPMEGIVPAKYDELLGLEEKGLTTSVACAVGYRSADDKYAVAPKVRFEKSALITEL